MKQKFLGTILFLTTLIYMSGCSEDNATSAEEYDYDSSFVSNTVDDEVDETGSSDNDDTFEVEEGDDDGGNATVEEDTIDDESTVEDLDIHDEEEDYAWTNDSITVVTFDGASITVDGDTSTYTLSKNIVTFKKGHVFELTGTGEGQIIVSSTDDENVNIIFNNIDITCTDCAPIYVEQSEKTIIKLAEGTVNTVTDAAIYTRFNDLENEEPDAAMFSKDDFTIFGEGSLTVNANYNDGITSKDGLLIKSGNITVNTVDDGLKGKDYLLIEGGTITINSEGDGLLSTNDEDPALGYIYIEDGIIDITSGAEAIQAYTKVIVNGGEITAVTNGGATVQEKGSELVTSGRGIKADFITINGGILDISAGDDAIHGDVKVSINGGDISLAAYDDAVHCDVSVEINGGTTIVTQAFEGVEADTVHIIDGILTVTTNDDGINGQDLILIDGGTVDVTVEGNDVDAFDSNGDIIINDGTVSITYPSTVGPNEAFDANGIKTLNGGTVYINGEEITSLE